MTIKIDKNKLFIDDMLILELADEIVQAERNLAGELVVLTDYPRDNLTDEKLYNLSKYTQNGQRIWRISYFPSLKRYAPIVGFNYFEGRLLATDRYGRAFRVNETTGIAEMVGIAK